MKGKKIVFLVVLCSALVFAVSAHSKQSFVSLADVLSNQELINSPEKSFEFVKAIVNEIQVKFPEILPLYDSVTLFKPIGQWLDEFCRKDINIQLEQIKKIRSKPVPKISLTMICDIHPALEAEQTGISKARQAFVSKKIKEINPQIVFAENIGKGLVTWPKLVADLRAASNGLINNPEQILKETSKWYWWSEFIDSKKMKIFGVEDNKLGMLITSLLAAPDTQENIELVERIKSINYLWREKVILANIIEVMRAEKKEKAVFVFGSFHQAPFSLLCKSWGINLTVIK